MVWLNNTYWAILAVEPSVGAFSFVNLSFIEWNVLLSHEEFLNMILQCARCLHFDLRSLMELLKIKKWGGIFYCGKKLPLTWWHKHKFRILLFLRLKVWHWSHWAKIKVLAELCSFLETLRDDWFPWPFQLLGVALNCCLMAPFFHLKSQQGQVKLSHHITDTASVICHISFSNCSLFHILRTPVITLGPPW